MGNVSFNLLLALLVVAVASPFSSSRQQIPSNATVYEVLALFGLPSGLLPASVKSYSYNEDDGQLTVVLPKPCYTQFSDLISYEDTITGVLEYGSIKEMNGISIRRTVIWMVVNEIKVDSASFDSIYFQVAFIYLEYSAGDFKEVRPCRDNGGCASAGNLEQQQHQLQALYFT